MNSPAPIERIFGTQAKFQEKLAEALEERWTEACNRETPIGKGKWMVNFFCQHHEYLTGFRFAECCEILSIDPFSVITTAICRKGLHTSESANTTTLEIYVDYVDRCHLL